MKPSLRIFWGGDTLNWDLHGVGHWVGSFQAEKQWEWDRSGILGLLKLAYKKSCGLWASWNTLTRHYPLDPGCHAVRSPSFTEATYRCSIWQAQLSSWLAARILHHAWEGAILNVQSNPIPVNDWLNISKNHPAEPSTGRGDHKVVKSH